MIPERFGINLCTSSPWGIIWALLTVLMSALQCPAAVNPPIYFTAAENQSWQIFQINSDGSGLRKVFSPEHNVRHISLSADGRKLLIIISDKKLLLLDLQTGETTPVEVAVKGMVDAVLDQDGKYLLFSLSTGGSNDANHIWLADLNSNAVSRLTHMPGMQHDPVWSHEDKSIFFLSGDGGQNEDIWRLDRDSGSLNQLTAGNRYNFELSCSLDNELVFSSNRSNDYEIWAMGPFGGSVRQLTHSPGMDSQPSWSPDGEHIVFLSTREGQPALYIMDREGQGSRRLTPEGLVCRNPVWSR
jgi:TolB protein